MKRSIHLTNMFAGVKGSGVFFGQRRTNWETGSPKKTPDAVRFSACERQSRFHVSAASCRRAVARCHRYFACCPIVLGCRLFFLVFCFAIYAEPEWLAAQTAPQIGYLFPAGAQRGSRVTIAVGGKFMPGPCGVWVGGKGVVAQSPTTEGEIEFVVDKNAASGSRPIRIHSVQGGSTPRPFIVGEFPEVVENESEQFQDVNVTPSVTINGRLHPTGDMDEYRLKLQSGQQIVCSVAARSIGSPSDTILRLLDSSGKVVAVGDDRGNSDPLLVFRSESAGTFTLQLFDFNLAGGAEHVYRLTLTDGPFLDYAYPAGVQSGTMATVTLHGWNLPGDTAQHSIEANGESHVVRIPGCANNLTIPVGECSESLEVEPNNTTEQSQVISVPQTINGRFGEAGDADVFQWSAKKGDRVNISVASADLGFPTDVVLRVTNSEGKLVREIDDVRPSRDPSYLFTVPTDGDYFLTLTERALRGGPRFIYRLEICPPQPSVRLTVKTTEFAIVPGESLTVPVRVEPLGGFAEEIELTAIDLPTGVTVQSQKYTPKKAADVKLEFKAAEDAHFKSGVFRIIAKNVSESESKQQIAIARSATPGLFSAPQTETLWMSISPRIPFELTLPPAIQEASRLAAFRFPVLAKRDDDFRDAIRLVGVEPDRRGTVVPLAGRIDAGQDAGSIPLIIQSQAVEGTTHRCRVMGVIEVTGPAGKQHPVFYVAKGSMAMGCQPNLLTLRADQERIECGAGDTVDVNFTVSRRVPLGDVTISILRSAGAYLVSAEAVKLTKPESHATMRLQLDKSVDSPGILRIQVQAATTRNDLPVYAQIELTIFVR